MVSPDPDQPAPDQDPDLETALADPVFDEPGLVAADPADAPLPGPPDDPARREDPVAEPGAPHLALEDDAAR